MMAPDLASTIGDEAAAADPVRRPAVVVNPVNVGDVNRLRADIEKYCRQYSTQVPSWLLTTEQDSGASQVREALKQGNDLILAVGGDGTVSACAGELSGSGVPLALVGTGTGNLLARNLGVPLDRAAALDVAFTGGRRRIDVCEEAGGQRFVVMAGLGFEAAMIRDTNPDTKARLGWLAYASGIARALHRSPLAYLDVTVDGGGSRRFLAAGVIVGNVGQLQAGLAILPDAVPDDGRIDAVILTPQQWTDWVKIAARAITRRSSDVDPTTTLSGRTISIRSDRQLPLEFDGEVHGQGQSLDLSIHPRALTVCVPNQPPSKLR